VVTPANEISNPPEYAGSGQGMWAASNRSSNAVPIQPEYGQSNVPAPSTLPTATPIADLGTQYGTSAASSSNDSWQKNLAASQPAGESSATTALSVPYQSGYGTTDYQVGGSANNSMKSATDRTNEPPARINAYEAQSVDSTSASGDSQYRQVRSNDATATAAISGPARTSRISTTTGAEASNTGIDQFAQNNQRRSTPQAAGGQVVGNQSPSSQTIAGQLPVNQSLANQVPASQYNYSPTYGASASTVAATVPPATMVQRNGEQYTVQPNDSYWTISEKTYGSGGYFKALYEYNRKRSKIADELKLGQVLLVPEEGVLRRNYPDLCPKPRKPAANGQQRLTSATSRLRGPGRVYTVGEGDTLFEIARHELGKPARWAEIYELNRDILGDDTDYLRPGTELILPATSEAVPRNNTATRQPEPIYSR
jgi:nucleoid-associated protein YgaU